MTTREALEAALVATPDDVAVHSAYADYLIEQGDPRGEYIRLQLAAEDRNQPAVKLRQYEQAAFEIRQHYEREWLAGLWPHLQRPPTAYSVAEPMEPNVSVTWRRGWIDAVRVGRLSHGIVAALTDNPYTRLLGSLVVEQNQWLVETPGVHGESHVMLSPVSFGSLLYSGRLVNLRHFEVGSAESREIADGGFLHDEIEEMSRLESVKLCVDYFSDSSLFGGNYPYLHTIHLTYNNPRCRFPILGYNDGLPNLKRLHLDIVSVMPLRGELGSEREPITESDLICFFRSKYLKALEYLTFRMGEFADAGVEELLSSGFINRLKGLDLCRCNITDDGAQMLAAHPHIPRLEYLHLDGNLLSPIGIDALEAVGVQVSPNQMFGPGDEAEMDLY